MIFRIEVYRDLLDQMPVVSRVVDNPLEAEAAVRELTEKYQKHEEAKDLSNTLQENM